MRRILFCALMFCCCSGCQMLKWAQPHQLWKLNRQPAMSRDEAYFSIPAEPMQQTAAEDPVLHQVRPF